MEWSDRIERDADWLALLITLETGKAIRDARAGDVPGVVPAIRWYAESAVRAEGCVPEQGDGVLALVERAPAGVVAAVTPWNFPLAAIGYEVAPALSIGNAVIVKPSERAPLSVLRCCHHAIDAGLPADALAVLPGANPIGEALGRHPDIDIATVIGSEHAGRAFLRYSADSNGKRVWPELGGKSAAIVCADADLARAAEAIAWGITFNQGQMCTGIARILVDPVVRDALLAALTARLDTLRLGDPLKDSTQLGAMISLKATAAVLDQVEAGADAGGVILRGGAAREVVPGGSYLEPTLILDAPIASRIWNEEVFGPVATVNNFTDVNDALRQAATPGFGMGLSVWTASLPAALSAARHARVGTVWINCFEADDLTVPAGGARRSGHGRTKGRAVFDKYADARTTWARIDP